MMLITQEQWPGEQAQVIFDVSSDNGDILFPDNGKLKAIDNTTTNSNNSTGGKESKPWWKFW